MPPPIPLRVQIAEIKRELTMRSRAYPRMIESGKLPAPEALRRSAALEAALATLENLAEERFQAESLFARNSRR